MPPSPVVGRRAAALLWLAAALAGGDAARAGGQAGGGAASWRQEAQGLFLRLTQILPDQLRAFYEARGFDPAAVERIARACVFQTELRNTGGTPLEVDLADWRLVTDRGTRPLRSKDSWLKEWEARGVPPPARLAFRWATFPAHQVFQPGDWNMGMLITDQPPGSRFDLEVRWRRGGKAQALVLEAVRCPGQPS